MSLLGCILTTHQNISSGEHETSVLFTAIVSKDGTRIIFLKHESVKTGISGEKKSGVGLRVGSRKSKCNTVVFLYQPYTDPGKPVSPQSTPEL